MPDIAMCANDRCPSRKKCYRHEGKANRNWQVWMDFVPPGGRDRCDSFLPLREGWKEARRG